MTDFDGKTAVVTAAGGAICGEIASGLAGEGANVAVWDINADAAGARVEAIGAAGGTAIVNITSIAGGLPLSRALAYTNGKAAANSFTRWLAVHMAMTYAPEIRVNAVAPGFMITEQNRFLMEDVETGRLTERGETVLRNVPMGRFGKPEEIVGATLWLLSDKASFVTGAIVTVDGGFSAFAGV